MTGTTERPRIVAHRGAWREAGHPQNSIAALAAAIEAGCECVEIDVRQSADGELLCIHDPSLRDADETLHNVGRSLAHDLDAANGEPLARLGDVVERCAGRIQLDVDVKHAHATDAVVDACGSLDDDEFVITSFHDAVIARVAERRPRVRRGLLIGRERPQPYVRTRLSELFPVRRANACSATFVSMHTTLARWGAARRARRAGMHVWVWTVNGDAELQRYLDGTSSAIDAVITDRPLRAIELRAAHPAAR